MTFTLSILLIPYIIFLALWFVLSLVGYYHLIRFGSRHASTYILGIVYFLGCVVCLQVTYLYIGDVNWSEMVTVFSNAIPAEFGGFSN